MYIQCIAKQQVGHIGGQIGKERSRYTGVSHKYAPPFCNLSLSTKLMGGLYAGCDNFSHDYALPSDKV